MEQQGEIRKDRWMEKLLKVLAEKEDTEERDDTKGTGKPGHNSGKLLCSSLAGFPPIPSWKKIQKAFPLLTGSRNTSLSPRNQPLPHLEL